jgi:hypothetical protein
MERSIETSRDDSDDVRPVLALLIPVTAAMRGITDDLHDLARECDQRGNTFAGFVDDHPELKELRKQHDAEEAGRPLTDSEVIEGMKRTVPIIGSPRAGGVVSARDVTGTIYGDEVKSPISAYAYRARVRRVSARLGKLARIGKVTRLSPMERIGSFAWAPAGTTVHDLDVRTCRNYRIDVFDA